MVLKRIFEPRYLDCNNAYEAQKSSSIQYIYIYHYYSSSEQTKSIWRMENDEVYHVLSFIQATESYFRS